MSEIDLYGASPAVIQEEVVQDPDAGDEELQPDPEEVVEAGEQDEAAEEVLLPPIDFEALARQGAEAAEAKKASRVTILHLAELSPIADYFVICSGATRLQTRAIANAIDEQCKSAPVRRRRQGYQSGNWILLDYGSVVFHVFVERDREYYDLEGLWSKAPVLYRGT